ncbi:hypothetical protein VTN96DRAFT_9093 [Rasamsonia emersonii]
MWECGGGPTLLYILSTHVYHELVNIVLLEKGADVNAQGGYYGNALQAALARGYKEIMAMLLEKGADVNAQGGYYGNALQAALARGYKEIMAMLLEKGADVNAQGGYYGNALQAALARGYKEIMAMLLEKGADVNAQGGVYGNALQLASVESDYGNSGHNAVDRPPRIDHHLSNVIVLITTFFAELWRQLFEKLNLKNH